MIMAHDISRLLDPTLFAQDCGLVLDPWQSNLLCSTSKRALLCCSRQSGKTTVTSIKALHQAVYQPGSLVVCVSPSQRQSAEMLRTIRMLHGQLEQGAPELSGDSVLKLEFRSGSRVVALPGTEKTVRGFAGASVVIIDEAARVEESLWSAVRPMLATTNGELIALSTPAGKRGAFYDLWHNGDPAWHRVSVPASECPRISKEFLASELRELGAAMYSQEYELAWIDSDTAAFSTAIIDAAFDPEVLPLWR
jgi:phage FluMu gp28-like protein